MEEDPTVLNFPITFNDTTVYEDRQILKSLKIVEYLRAHLPNHRIVIDTCGTAQLRVYVVKPDGYASSYNNCYRIRLSDKPADKQSILTGQGRKFCVGIDNLIAIKAAELLQEN
jgi:hypothetical protein